MGSCAEDSVPEIPVAGTAVAVIVPLPVTAMLAPVPITNALLVLVPPVKEGQVEEPLPEPQGAPASTTLPLASHFAQSLLTPAALPVTYFEPLPRALLVVTALAGSLAADKVPLKMLLALVVSVVAEGARPVTPLAGTAGRRAADKVPLKMLPALVVSVVAEGARPATPLAGTEVAAITPVPEAVNDAPEPMTMAAAVLVPPLKEVKAPLLQGKPASITLPLASHLAQSLLEPAVMPVKYFEPLPRALLVVTAVAGRRAADKVPLEMLLALVVSVVAEGARPVTPLAGTDVAAIDPVPVVESDAPEPMTNALPVLVPPAKEGQVEEPVPVPQGAPASTTLPLESHLAQSFPTPAEVTVAYLEPVPEALLVVTTVAGSLAADKVPLEMLLALVVSVVAEGARPVTPVAGTDVAAMEPVPVAESDAPEPITMAAPVFVPPAKEGKVLAAVTALRTACSVGRLLLEPGEPMLVTTPRPVDRAVPLVLLN